MAEHLTATTKQWMDSAQLNMLTKYAKACESRDQHDVFGRVFDAIKKA